MVTLLQLQVLAVMPEGPKTIGWVREEALRKGLEE